MKMRKVYLLAFFLTNVILVFGQTSPNKEKLFIPNGKVALIGYGSLMSIALGERSKMILNPNGVAAGWTRFDATPLGLGKNKNAADPG